jgi:hypothetical protein
MSTGPLAGLGTSKLYQSSLERQTVASGDDLVLADITGDSGCVRSVWMAVGGGNNPTLDARLQVFYDGLTTPGHGPGDAAGHALAGPGPLSRP